MRTADSAPSNTGRICLQSRFVVTGPIRPANWPCWSLNEQCHFRRSFPSSNPLLLLRAYSPRSEDVKFPPPYSACPPCNPSHNSDQPSYMVSSQSWWDNPATAPWLRPCPIRKWSHRSDSPPILNCGSCCSHSNLVATCIFFSWNRPNKQMTLAGSAAHSNTTSVFLELQVSNE